MERFIQLFSDFLSLVYHCFDRIVIHGYLSGLSRPEQVVYFYRQVFGHPRGEQRGPQPTHQRLPGLGRGVCPQPQDPDGAWSRAAPSASACPSFRRKIPTIAFWRTNEAASPTTTSIRDAVLGPIIVRVASFFPFHATYWLNGHSFIEQRADRVLPQLHLQTPSSHSQDFRTKAVNSGSGV